MYINMYKYLYFTDLSIVSQGECLTRSVDDNSVSDDKDDDERIFVSNNFFKLFT